MLKHLLSATLPRISSPGRITSHKILFSPSICIDALAALVSIFKLECIKDIWRQQFAVEHNGKAKDIWQPIKQTCIFTGNCRGTLCNHRMGWNRGIKVNIFWLILFKAPWIRRFVLQVLLQSILDVINSQNNQSGNSPSAPESWGSPAPARHSSRIF